MKKILAIVLAALMLLGMVACAGSTPAASTTKTETKVTATEAPKTEAKTEEKTETKEEPKTEEKKEEPKQEETAEATGCIWAGEYDLTFKTQEGDESPVDTFEIDAEGNVTGAVEDSGMTTFEGKIDENGHFECELPRLGGTMVGDIDKTGHLTCNMDARGRKSTMEGVIVGGMPEGVGAEAAATGKRSYAGEYDLTFKTQEGDESPVDTFEIDEEGNVTGAVEDSGMTTFEGKIDENGHFECELPRLGGTMVGDIDENGHLTCNMDARGRKSTMEGDIVK